MKGTNTSRFRFSEHAILTPSSYEPGCDTDCDPQLRMPLVAPPCGTKKRKLVLHHIDARHCLHAPTYVKSSRLSYTYFLFPSLYPCRFDVSSYYAAVASRSWSWRRHAGTQASPQILSICGETTTVLAAALTRWRVCCQMSGFCLCLGETLAHVKPSQRHHHGPLLLGYF